MTAKVFKMEVHDYGNDEINCIAMAHAALSRIPPGDSQNAAINYLIARLEADRKKRIAELDAAARAELDLRKSTT